MRAAIHRLAALGSLPASDDADAGQLDAYQQLLDGLRPPVSDAEAEVLTGLFPPDRDDCYGRAWTLVHLVETAPGWPLPSCLQRSDGWIGYLRQRADRAGHLDAPTPNSDH
jgi:hypothetical protein